MPERLTRRQLKQDRFLQWIYAAWAWGRDNMSLVAAGALGLVALVVVGVRVGGSTIGSAAGDPAAERLLTTARSQFLAGNSEAALAALDELRSSRGSSRAGREATYLLANALYESGEHARARAVFEDFLRKPLHEDLTRDAARTAIAACREETADFAGAAEGYLALWRESANPAVRAQSALSAARCFLAEGDRTRAAEIYRQLSETFPASPEADEARFRLLELDTPS